MTSFDVETDVYGGVDFEKAAEDALDTIAVRVLEAWRENMLDADYRNTGETINSLTIDSPSKMRRVIGSDRIAAVIGEYGRPPGAGHPPPDKLGDWVHEQAGLPNRGGTVEWDFGDGPETVTFNQVVFLIGAAIDENGLPAHHFGERAAKEHDVGELEREVEKRIDQQIEAQETG